MNQWFFISTIIFLLTIPCPNGIFAQIKSTINQKHIDSLKSNGTNQDKKDTFFFEISESIGIPIPFEIMPEFPGGDQALIEYVIKNTNYPLSAIKDSIEGRVIIRFAVDMDGSTCDTAVLRGIRPDLNRECMRVIIGMPKWKPGSAILRSKKGYYSTNVKIWYSIPFTFSLTNSENKRGIIITPRQIQ